MTKRFLSTISVPSLSVEPEGHAGSIYFNNVDKTLHVHDGTSWSPASVEYIKTLFVGVPEETLQHEGIDVRYDTATNRIVLSLQQTEYTKSPSGFVNYTDSIIEWNSSLKKLNVYPRVFTEYKNEYDEEETYLVGDVVLYTDGRYYERILVGEIGDVPTGASWQVLSRNYLPNSFTFYVSGKRIVKDVSDEWSPPSELGVYSPGTYHIYYNSEGSLLGKLDHFNLQEDSPVAVVLINELGDAVFIADDRSNVAIDWATKEYLRKTSGLTLEGFGFSIGDYTESGDGTLETDYKYSLTNGDLFNVDRKYSVTHSNTPTLEYEQYLTPFVRTKTYYRHQDHWDASAVNDYSFVLSGGIPAYNFNNNGSWELVPVEDNKYFAVWIVATNNIGTPIVALLGQDSYNNLNQALDEASFSSLNLDDAPEGLYAPLYRLLFNYNSTYTNTTKTVLKSVTDIRSSSSAGGGTSITDHGALSGLTDDDHTQYVHISNSRTITAQHTFNPSTVEAPFVIGENAAGQLVSGLNVEKLGGKTYTEINQEAFTYSQGAVTDAVAQSNGYTDTQFLNIDAYVAPLLNHSDHEGVAVSWNDSLNKITLDVEEPTKVLSNPPPNPAEGDNWYDYESGVFYVYDGTFWVEVSGGAGAEAASLPSTLQYLEGTTSNIQDQIDSKAPLNSPTFTGSVALPSSTTLDGSAIAKSSDITPLATKESPTFTGNVSLPSTTSIGDVDATEIGYLNGVTSAIQTQINSKISANNATLTGITNLPSTTYIGTITPIEIGHLSGVTSNIQASLNNKVESSNFTTSQINVQIYNNFSDLPSASDNSGRMAYVNSEGAMYFAHSGSWFKLAKFSDIATGGAAFPINELSDVDTSTVAPSQNDILSWDGVNWVPTNPASASGAAPSESPTFTGTVVLPETTSIGNVDSTEISYLDGATSNIQTQIDSKAPSSDPSFSGVVVLPGTTSIGDVDSTEIGYLNGVTSSIQTQINAKLATADFTYSTISIPTYSQFENLPTASSNTGRLGYVSGSTALYYSNGTSWIQIAKFSDLPPTTVSAINDLTDVDTSTSSPSQNQVLAWNGTNWVPQTISIPPSITTYPAITQLDVTSNGTAGYQFNNQYSGDNPIIYAINATTIAFKLNVPGHPFLIQTSGGTNYDNGLVHVATDGTISTGSQAQGQTTGTLYWQIPSSVSGTYRYQCSIHAGMVGDIIIKNIASMT